MDRKLRLPLQVGTSSLVGFAHSAAAFVPGCLLFVTIAIPALVAPWDEAIAVYPHLVVPYIFAVLAGTGLVAYARKHFWLALRERPSDVVFSAEGLHVEGGALGGFRTTWADVDSARLVGRHEKLEVIEEEGDKTENFWQLVLELKDGSTKRLGSAEDRRERDSLQALLDTIKAALSREASKHQGVHAAPVHAKSFSCGRCGAPAIPNEHPSVGCRFCGAEIPVPDDVRARVRAMTNRDAAAKRSERLVAKLVKQPGALRTGFFVMLAAIPSLLAWPAAIVGAVVLYALCYLRVGNAILLGVAACTLIVALYYLVRGQLTDRQALRMITVGFAARAPSAAGEAHRCRTCNAPLVEPPGTVLVRCVHCNAQNVLGLDVTSDAKQSKNQVDSLEEALERRHAEHARYRWSAFLSLGLFAVAWLLVVASLHAPNPLKATGDALELKRITYDPFNEFQPKVSPDGSELLYDLRVPGEDSDETVMTAPAKGTFRGKEMTQEKMHAMRPLWLENGSGFLYVSGAKREILRRVDSLQPYARAQDLYSFGYDIDVPSMAPDGKHMVFAAANTKSAGWSVYLGTLDGAPQQLLLSGINPAWSPDGWHIAFSRTVSSYRQLMMMVVDTTTSPPSVLTSWQLTDEPCDHEDPVFSPDGAYLAYVGNCGTNTRGKKSVWDLYALKVDGTQNEQLTDGKADVETPTWSGDDVYFSANVAGNYDIWRVRVKGPLAGHGKRLPQVAALAAPPEDVVAAAMASAAAHPNLTPTTTSSSKPRPPSRTSSSSSSSASSQTVFRVPVGSSPVRGKSTALVTIVEFSDYQCPFCVRAESTLRALAAKYGDDLRIVWKDNPLAFHRYAPAAAELALEARDERGDDAFWLAHDDLLASTSLNDTALMQIAASRGLDAGKVKAAIASHKHKSSLAADQTLAQSVSATGDPTFFINGRVLVGAQPQSAFDAIIQQELQKARLRVRAGTPRAKVYDAILAGP